MRRRLLTRLSFVLGFLFLAPPVAAETFDAVRAKIQKALAEHNLPSVTVAVARDGKIIWEEGFGWADRAKRLPATPHTTYSVASISKPITATGLMILVERGLVDLDRPINDYLGDAKVRARVGDAAQATVRRVLAHMAGLPLHYQFLYEDEPYPRPPMEETIRRYANLVTAPGERFQYSNLGYGLLDYVIERLSGKSYADFMREEVFLPLGMTRSAVGLGAALEGFDATRYTPQGVPVPFYDFDHPGGSAVFASAYDLARFGMFHLRNHLADQRAILKDTTVEQMQRSEVTTEPRRGYALGWGWQREQSDTGLLLVGHAGGMSGVSTRLWLVPEANVVVVVLINTNTAPNNEHLATVLAHDILGALFPGKTETRASAPTKPEPFRPDRSLVGSWRGEVHTYNGKLPLVLEVKEGGDVHARLDSQLETVLNEPSFREGFLRGRMLGDIKTEDANRRRYFLLLDAKLRGNVLNGSLTAISDISARGNALTCWVELKKEE